LIYLSVFWISDQTLSFTHHSFVNIHSKISAGIDNCRVTRVDPPLLISTTMLLKGDQTGVTLCTTLNIQNFSEINMTQVTKMNVSVCETPYPLARNAFLVDLSYHCAFLDATIVRVAAATWWTRTRFVCDYL
jgi:hypothetical protein